MSVALAWDPLDHPRDTHGRFRGSGATDGLLARLTKPLEGLKVEETGFEDTPTFITGNERYLTVDDPDNSFDPRLAEIGFRVGGDGISVDHIAVNRRARKRGMAIAITAELHRRYPDKPLIQGSFATPEGARYGVGMAANFPEWNKLWLDTDANGKLVYWKPGDPIDANARTFDPMLYETAAYRRDPETGEYSREPLQRMIDEVLARAKTRRAFEDVAFYDPDQLRDQLGRWTKAPDVGYRGRYTAARPEPGASMDNPYNIFPADLYTAKGPQYYGNAGGPGGPDPTTWPMDQATWRILMRAHRHPEAPVKVYRAMPPGLPRTINPGDWVTPNRDYAVRHGESTLLGDYEIAEAEAKAGDLYTDGNSIHEWGWWPQARGRALAWDPIEHPRDRATGRFRESAVPGEEGLAHLPGRPASRNAMQRERYDLPAVAELHQTETMRRVEDGFHKLGVKSDIRSLARPREGTTIDSAGVSVYRPPGTAERWDENQKDRDRQYADALTAAQEAFERFPQLRGKRGLRSVTTYEAGDWLDLPGQGPPFVYEAEEKMDSWGMTVQLGGGPSDVLLRVRAGEDERYIGAGTTAPADWTAYGRMWHEMGHAVFNASFHKSKTHDKLDALDKLMELWGIREDGPEPAREFSEYGAQNPREFFAEVFASLNEDRNADALTAAQREKLLYVQREFNKWAGMKVL
jgi:hypothetical protein